MHKQIVQEEHYVLIKEPNSHYLGHVVPSSGSAKDISSAIMAFLSKMNYKEEDLVAVGCDGTVINTGRKGGVIAMIENNLQRPLQWLICLLHANELPLRHLIQETDGKTSGPSGFHGPIGSKLSNCESKEIVKFSSISSENIDIETSDLSTDQSYMLEAFNAVSSGHCSPSLANINPGNMSHSRWLSTANRVLRLYISEETPSKELIRIVIYIIHVYVPVWFAIKRIIIYPRCQALL